MIHHGIGAGAQPLARKEGNLGEWPDLAVVKK